MAKILKCPGCDREIRTGKTRDLNKHMNLNGNLRKGQCQPALLIMQNVGNVTPEQNTPQIENVTPEQNTPSTPEGDLISFDENPPTLQPREASAPAVDLLTDDVPNTEAGSSSNTQEEQKKKSILTIDELIKWLSKPEIKNNKKIRSKHIPKNNKEWYDLMEIDNEKDSEPSDSEYDTAEEEPDIHFEKIKDPYINRIAEARKFNEGEVCDYYAFVPKGYYAEGEPLAFFESVEEKIADVYKRELALKGGLKHETIEIIREDRINATIEKGYNKIIDQIEDEAIQESGWAFVRAEEVFLEISAFRPLRGSSWLSLPEDLDKPQLGLINPQNFKDNECFRDCVNIHHAREDALKAGQKPTHLERVSKIRRYGNIANFEGINFPATLHDVDKFEENNPNYAINIFRPVYKEVFGKIKVDIDPLHISERNYQVKHMIDLLYLTEGEENLNDRKNANDIPEGLKTHYVFITDFTRLMRKWNNHHGKKYFCRKCLRFPYSRLDLLEKHIPTCPGPSKAPQRLILPEEGKNYVKPKYFKNMLKKPYLITMDLEAEEIEVEKKDNEENTIKLAEQKAISYGYTIHCSDGTTQKPVINRESENIIKDLMENLQEDLEVILDKLREIVPCEKMTPELWRKYQTANKCWICEEKLHEAGYNKIRVFDAETKKYLGASHRKCHGKKSMIQGKLDDEQKEKHKSCKVCMYCKTQLPDEEKNRVIDHDHITGKFRGPAHKIAKVTDEKIVPIANNSEQYITFSVGQLQFIDKQLAKCFPIMSKFISPHLLSLLTRKGIFPYQWLNNKTKFNETQLPPRKDFNSDLDGFNYCDHNCRIEKCEHGEKIGKCKHKCQKCKHKKEPGNCNECEENKECEHKKIYTISQKDYDFAHMVWRETECKTFGDYHDIYLKTDVLILADAFEAFRKASYSAFKLDPANYLTAPGLAWDACMKVTKLS
ncbi:12690_t:CDS:2 [Entrophospora sp. SA101]|nr:12690_t:CDS:2 [Entrophospora sp. SA101]